MRIPCLFNPATGKLVIDKKVSNKVIMELLTADDIEVRIDFIKLQHLLKRRNLQICKYCHGSGFYRDDPSPPGVSLSSGYFIYECDYCDGKGYQRIKRGEQ